LAVGGIGLSLCQAVPAPAVKPFFEPNFPFFQSQVEVTPRTSEATTDGNFVVRGIVIPLASGQVLLFDQELLRVAAVWDRDADAPPITLRTMAQISYDDGLKKASGLHPMPTGPVTWVTPEHPGVAVSIADLFHDPRVSYPGDAGRGPLPPAQARFLGIELTDTVPVLRYSVGTTEVREWHESGRIAEGTNLFRHWEVGPSTQPVVFALGRASVGKWELKSPGVAALESENSGVLSQAIHVRATPGLTLDVVEGELVAWLRPSAKIQRVSVAWGVGSSEDRLLGSTPAVPVQRSIRRWPEQVRSAVDLATTEQNGLQLDYIATPDENPWGRRVRAADIAFLTPDRAAVVTYDGDVWLVDGLAREDLADLRWQRFASGLHESLAVVAVDDVIQVATKNGLIRLHDRDGNGEADWYENFNDQLLQSQTTRSFPLDMALGPDGSTYLTQGGIVDRGGIGSGGAGTPHTGAIVKISSDGKMLTTFASGAREPFVAVHPRTGSVTATDQQGHFIPSSVVYQVHEGDFFGFPEPKPITLTPPLVWIPHELDTSSSSQLWIEGKGMGVWEGRLLHLSYGTGRLFVITPDQEAPLPQGTAIPLEIKTEVPLLHARMHPSGQAVYLAGFALYGSRVAHDWALGRLRPGPSPTTTAVSARTVRDGIVLEFAHPLDPASLTPEHVQLRVWNYLRSAAYGSGRYAMDGSPGATRLGAAQVVLSRDQHSVFVHVPGLPNAMQLEVRHEFRFASGSSARGSVYATVHQAQEATKALAGFPPIDLSRQAVALVAEKEVPATSAAGKIVAESFGCLACHSIDGSVEGKVGPTWQGLFGAERVSFEGRREVADEAYLRDRILDPQQKRSKSAQVEMPSFRGVLGEQQIESLVLYIKSLSARSPAQSRAK